MDTMKSTIVQTPASYSILAADSTVSGVGFFLIGFYFRKKLHLQKSREAMRLGQSVPTDPAPSLPYCRHLISTLTTMKEPILMPCCNQSQSFIPISLVFT